VAERSRTHLVLIPSYNPGPKVFETVRAALAAWEPVWVVTDGSTDGTPGELQALERDHAGLRVIVLERNGGKGGAVLHGARIALRDGFTHALTMDSDGQHPPEGIETILAPIMAGEADGVIGACVDRASRARPPAE
jgi:hypothetical protein